MIGQEDGGSVDALFVQGGAGYNAQQNTLDLQGETLDVEFGNMYTRELVSFGDSLLNGTPLTVPAQDAVEVQRIIEAAYRSNDEKQIIDL